MADLFAHPAFDDHEQVLLVSDRGRGLKGFIAIHMGRQCWRGASLKTVSM